MTYFPWKKYTGFVYSTIMHLYWNAYWYARIYLFYDTRYYDKMSCTKFSTLKYKLLRWSRGSLLDLSAGVIELKSMTRCNQTLEKKLCICANGTIEFEQRLARSRFNVSACVKEKRFPADCWIKVGITCPGRVARPPTDC